ncbi:putative membrane protein (plasmid) [Ensifer sp. WSM1721]|uniref:cytochrome c oxidase assembly protein n=1 Tax=Ensifer sp. WSM1721 TaxID=1041159 RepID=UPI0004B49128
MGPLAMHMSVHILLMNLVAPLAALGASRIRPERQEVAAGMLALATLAQLVALWTWHAPPLLNRALEFPSVHLLMYGSLFLTAVLFWWTVFRFSKERCWQPIVALLVTSKLYCLLAVLFVFAPRALYPNIAHAHPSDGAPVLSATLADQHLAGLIMLAACPATYVLAAIAIGARWLFAMETGKPQPDVNPGEEAWS